MRIFILALVLSVFTSGVTGQKKTIVYDTLSCGRIEIDASFPGGEKNWQVYLTENFRESRVRCQMTVRDTTYAETAIIQFMISKDGSIANVKCMNSKIVSSALKNEAERLIIQSPKWSPAYQNGRVVNGYRIQTISITVSPLYL